MSYPTKVRDQLPSSLLRYTELRQMPCRPSLAQGLLLISGSRPVFFSSFLTTLRRRRTSSEFGCAEELSPPPPLFSLRVAVRFRSCQFAEPSQYSTPPSKAAVSARQGERKKLLRCCPQVEGPRLPTPPLPPRPSPCLLLLAPFSNHSLLTAGGQGGLGSLCTVEYQRASPGPCVLSQVEQVLVLRERYQG